MSAVLRLVRRHGIRVAPLLLAAGALAAPALAQAPDAAQGEPPIARRTVGHSVLLPSFPHEIRPQVMSYLSCFGDSLRGPQGTTGPVEAFEKSVASCATTRARLEAEIGAFGSISGWPRKGPKRAEAVKTLFDALDETQRASGRALAAQAAPDAPPPNPTQEHHAQDH